MSIFKFVVFSYDFFRITWKLSNSTASIVYTFKPQPINYGPKSNEHQWERYCLMFKLFLWEAAHSAHSVWIYCLRFTQNKIHEQSINLHRIQPEFVFTPLMLQHILPPQVNIITLLLRIFGFFPAFCFAVARKTIATTATETN